MDQRLSQIPCKGVEKKLRKGRGRKEEEFGMNGMSLHGLTVPVYQAAHRYNCTRLLAHRYTVPVNQAAHRVSVPD